MPKGTFSDDLFEQIVEFGKSTGKATSQAMKQTFGPKALWEAAIGKQSSKDKGIEQLEKGKGKKPNHTPLDFQKLQEKYKDQDKTRTDALRQRLFQLVKSGEEKTVVQKKQKIEQKKQQELVEQEQKKRKEEEKKRIQAQAEVPKGKERRSIFSPIKVAKRERLEVHPSAGKQ